MFFLQNFNISVFPIPLCTFQSNYFIACCMIPGAPSFQSSPTSGTRGTRRNCPTSSWICGRRIIVYALLTLRNNRAVVVTGSFDYTTMMDGPCLRASKQSECDGRLRWRYVLRFLSAFLFADIVVAARRGDAGRGDANGRGDADELHQRDNGGEG